MSGNMRIVYDNTADRGTVVTSNTAGSLVATNMLTDRKSETYRSTGTSTTITLTTPSAEFVGFVGLIFCNLTSSSTIRVRTYTNVSDPSPIVDTGAVLAAAATPLSMWEWGNVPLGVNAYHYYGASHGRAWFNTHPVKKVVVDVVDTSNPSGYIEISRLVTGAYFTPENDAELDATWTSVDTTKSERNDSSDLISEIGSKNKKITFSLGFMTKGDRNSVVNILRGNGTSRPVFVSLFPDNEDSSQEQVYQVYGKLSQTSTIGMPLWEMFNSTIEIEES